MSFKVVCCGTDFPNQKAESDALKALPDCNFVYKKLSTPDEIVAECKDADGIIDQWNVFNADMFSKLEKCKVIATCGIGVDRFDVPAATAKGIYVCNSPDYNKQEVANHATALIMALSRQLFQMDKNMRNGKYGWFYLDRELCRPDAQTLGLISFGKISSKIAHKCKEAFGMRVIAYDPYVPQEIFDKCGVEKVDLETLFKESDYLSINGPLTKENFHMVNYERLCTMKPTAYVINTARGGLVDTDGIVKALEEKKIAGAALDVFEQEPLPIDHPLFKFDNVILTPHSAWYTKESMYENPYGAARQVAMVLNGEVPDRCLNYDAVNKVLGK